jgi:hypothetical protein
VKHHRPASPGTGQIQDMPRAFHIDPAQGREVVVQPDIARAVPDRIQPAGQPPEVRFSQAKPGNPDIDGDHPHPAACLRDH